MSKPVKILWPSPDEEGICLSQSDNTGPLIINGPYAVPSNSNNTYALLPGIQRIITLTSVNNLTTSNFEIIGSDFLGRTVSEVIAGPNNNTVSTTIEFNRVDSIESNNLFLNNISVGTGISGHTNWFMSDYQKTFNALTVSVAVADNITYSFETTLEDPAQVAVPIIFEPVDGVTIPTVPAATGMIASTVNVVTNYAFPTVASRISISAGDATGALIAFFLQQGIS